MPQADQATIDKMKDHFGDKDHGHWDMEAQKYLTAQGYREDRFQWHPKPGVTSVHDMEEKEYVALWYLVTEWDWGGLIKPGDHKEPS